MKAQKFYIFIACCLLFSFFLLYFLLRYFGKRYDQGLESLVQTSYDAPFTRKGKTVRKITILQEDGGCMDVSSNGVVQVYEECGGDPSVAHRVSDPKFVLRLIQRVSEIDGSKFKEGSSGAYLTLIIETEDGTETIFIPIGDNEISKTIDLIKGQLPQPTPTSDPHAQTPTPTMGGVSHTPTSTPSVFPSPGPSPTPNQNSTGSEDNPFTCGYGETQGGSRPYNISNIICSTEPSPPLPR
ncbi:MAG: hypothetical protein N3A54_05260 [Patescibacteria group bacterium]|nr:hypothetical protein [Patescibacteria group bacterium]